MNGLYFRLDDFDLWLDPVAATSLRDLIDTRYQVSLYDGLHYFDTLDNALTFVLYHINRQIQCAKKEGDAVDQTSTPLAIRGICGTKTKKSVRKKSPKRSRNKGV